MKITGNENNITILKEMGERFRDTRISMMLTREDLAAKSGVSLSTLVRIEDGANASMEQYLNLMRALGLLGNMESLIPEYQLSPVDIADGKQKRKRASRKKSNTNTTAKSSWRWGDEQ